MTCLPFIRSGQNYSTRHSARGRRKGRQRNRWEDLEFAKSQWAVENRGKMEETGCEDNCGAQPASAASQSDALPTELNPHPQPVMRHQEGKYAIF